ncbi:MAG: family 20 glycosylhydrolase [Treponema sp.]|nr:family 20 glycosylhydrolase [Treponema sp.]MCL2272862.1 family 20 glycosylhydrolase [Treponema sp.]
MLNHVIKAAHLRIREAQTADILIQYIREGLAPLGINFLCLELNPGYNYRCFPELADGTFGRDEARRVAAAAKETGIRIVPLFMCLGHQGWRFKKNALLRTHPEFDETPEIPEDGDAENTPDLEFYCHSWCASNDDVYKYVFPMIDEIMEDLEADCIHVGMDEVFSLAVCPRCKNKSRAELFARTVNILHDHIVKEKGWQMMMWADRLNHAEAFGYHAWEGDIWGTWNAAGMIPNDILLADWHYEMNEKGFPGIEALLEKGFTVIPASWRELKQTRFLLDEALKYSRLAKEKGYKGVLAGMMVTCWSEADSKLIDELLKLVKTKELNEEAKDIRGIASSVVYIADKLKNYEP